MNTCITGAIVDTIMVSTIAPVIHVFMVHNHDKKEPHRNCLGPSYFAKVIGRGYLLICSCSYHQQLRSYRDIMSMLSHVRKTRTLDHWFTKPPTLDHWFTRYVVLPEAAPLNPGQMQRIAWYRKRRTMSP